MHPLMRSVCGFAKDFEVNDDDADVCHGFVACDQQIQQYQPSHVISRFTRFTSSDVSAQGKGADDEDDEEAEAKPPQLFEFKLGDDAKIHATQLTRKKKIMAKTVVCHSVCSIA